MKDQARFIRKVVVAAYDMDLDQYEELFGTSNRFHMMSSDFIRWYCALDTENAEKFVKWAEEKTQ